VFSPYYAFARRGGRPADPLDHCAINVALYNRRGGRWAMTERGSASVKRDVHHLAIGPSDLSWDGQGLTIRIDEITAPWPRRLRGTVHVSPLALHRRSFVLSEHGEHRWWPLAPCSRVQVRFDEPHLAWQGDGYLDSNFGSAPLEADFVRWQWSRGVNARGTTIVYEADRRDGGRSTVAALFDTDGEVRPHAPPPVRALPPTRWRIAREVHSMAPPKVLRTVTDAPFYARSVVSADLDGEPAVLMHESLSLERFRQPLVQAMLPFRVPRSRR
jgi:carotenoid 1,2-hydratase